MKLTLLKVILEQFKGVAHAEYDFGNKTAITGKNGSGKTTIADAVLWLFADKDYGLKSNPEIHPDFLPISEPSVTAVCDIDGKEVTFRKFQKDSRTKKQVEAGAPVRISNQYEINSVPKSQKDFMAYLEECGINVETMLLLSHPEIFINQKDADCRKILFGMTSDITDKQIADSLPDCKEAAELLESYTAEEITAMKKREKKEASENLDAIPQQIIGMEKSKMDVNIEEFTAQRNTLCSEIEQMEKSIEDMDIPNIGDLNQQLALLDQEERQLVAKANADRVEKLTKLNLLIGTMEQDLREATASKQKSTNELDEFLRNQKLLETTFNKLREEFDALKESEFQMENGGKCPTCGQNLPVHEIDKAKTAFEENKKSRMTEINRRAKEILDGINAGKGRLKELDLEIKEADKLIMETRSELNSRYKEREPLEYVIDASKSDEAVAINQKRIEIKHKMANADNMKAEVEEIRGNIRVREQAVREIDNRIVEARVNDRIDIKIEELRQKQKVYADSESAAQMVLDQLSQISMAKNKALTDEVNSHFELVKFRLFYTQKDGQIKDDCTPFIMSSDGKYKNINNSANTALVTLAKLDIIKGLQKYYGVYLPVFIDNCEHLDSENMKKIKMDTQIIALKVAETDLTISEF